MGAGIDAKDIKISLNNSMHFHTLNKLNIFEDPCARQS